MPRDRWSAVTDIKCTEGHEEMECRIEREADFEDVDVSVSTVTVTDLHPHAITKFSQDRYDTARDQEYSVGFIDGLCVLDKNPKGNPSLTCTGAAEDAY